jgi:hypothetical protein
VLARSACWFRRLDLVVSRQDNTGGFNDHKLKKVRSVIIERNGQELARDILHIDGAADARRKLMQLVWQHDIDPFEEPINCRVEELSE